MKEKFPKKFLAIVLSMFLLMFLFVGSYATDSGGITQLFSSTKTSETTTVTDRNSTTIRPSTTENHSTITTAYQTITSITDTATSATKVTITDVDISETVYRYDWLLYKVINDEVTIVGAVDAVGEKEVPAEIDGYPVRIIDEWAFIQCSRLTAITVSETVTSIGEGAFFYGCDNLQYNIEGNLKYLGNNENKYLYLAGATSDDITSVTINPNCRFIGESAFWCCTSLTSIEIPDSVTSIGNSAFSGCSSLTSIVIPEGVTSIGGSAFSNCTSLTSVIIPESVTSFNTQTFAECNNLKNVVLPIDERPAMLIAGLVWITFCKRKK